jgi:hypothetical protein
MLEKRYRTHVRFFEWLKAGVVIAVFSCLIAWGGIAVLSPYMPTREQRGLEAVERMKHDGIEHMPVTVSQQSKEYAGVLDSHAMHRQRSAEVISK